MAWWIGKSGQQAAGFRWQNCTEIINLESGASANHHTSNIVWKQPADAAYGKIQLDVGQPASAVRLAPGLQMPSQTYYVHGLNLSIFHLLPSLVYCNLSWRRDFLPCQNSMMLGTTKYPPQLSGRGISTASSAYFCTTQAKHSTQRSRREVQVHGHMRYT